MSLILRRVKNINRRVPRTGAIDQEDRRENSQREAYEIRGVDGGRDPESSVRDLPKRMGHLSWNERLESRSAGSFSVFGLA